MGPFWSILGPSPVLRRAVLETTKFGRYSKTIRPRPRRARPHRKALGELYTGLVLGVEQREQRLLLGVVGLRGIAGRGADALVLFQDQILLRQRLVRRIAPELPAHAGMHALGEGF